MDPRKAGRNGMGGNGSRGQATVEFALLIPLMLLVITALVYVGVGLNCYLTVSTASREGAREGARSCSPQSAREAARSALKHLPGGEKEIRVSFPEGRKKGKPISVKVKYRLPFLLPFLEKFVPSITMSKTTFMTLERDP